ncbi:MAG TPA: CHASE3 domain-containing protein, partial [Myxococcota bacterium]
MGGTKREQRQQLTIRAGMALALALLVGVGVKSFTDARREAAATQWVAHTHEVLENLHSLLNGLGTAEAALRGWSLSGDPTIVAEVEPAITLTSSSITRARSLLVDNATQKQRLESIAALVEERLAMMHARLLEIRAGARPAYSPAARALSDRIRHETALMIDTERELLAVRTRERTS